MSMNTNAIYVYVTGKNLAQILSALPLPPGLTVEVTAIEAGTRINPRAFNVFILKKIPQKIIDGAKYVLCSKSYADVDRETLDVLYDLWPEPLTAPLLGFYFLKLIDRVRLELESTSEEIEHRKRIVEMARQDYLTGLATRWYLQEYISKNQNESNVTCIYFDLDNFKKVNDTYGHQAGDRALAATAEMMQREFTDGFCARMGGDEFMIVLLGQRNALEVEEKVNAFMADLLEYYAGTKTMTALSISAGIAQKINGEEKSIDILIHESDMALYEAKKSGRSCCCVYSPSMEQEQPKIEAVRTYYLVDYENVHAQGLDGIHKLDESCTVCIFYSRNASRVTSGLNFGIMESKATITYHHADAGAKNALDFQLSSYLGELISENTGIQCRYCIISRDSGFAALVSFWREKGVEVELLSDISGRGIFFHDTLAQRGNILTGETQLAPDIASIIRRCKTKSDVNNALQKLYKGTKRSGQIYRAIKVLIDNKPGGLTRSHVKTVEQEETPQEAE